MSKILWPPCCKSFTICPATGLPVQTLPTSDGRSVIDHRKFDNRKSIPDDLPPQSTRPRSSSDVNQANFQRIIDDLVMMHDCMLNEVRAVRAENKTLRNQIQLDRISTATKGTTQEGEQDSQMVQSSLDTTRSEDSPAPKNYQIRNIWTDESSPQGRVTPHVYNTGVTAITDPSFNGSDEQIHDSHIQEYDGFLRHFIISPANRKRVAWDFLGATFIFYDLIAVPLFLVFDPPDTGFTIGMDWLLLLFWTLNVYASVCVGYVTNGITVMVPHMILSNYLKTWFIVDVCVLAPDWTFTIMAMSSTSDKSAGAGSGFRLLRILRLIRMIRLVRLLKLRKLLQNINEIIDSEYLSILSNIVKMILCLLAINHMIACAWFWLATTSDVSWISEHGFVDEKWAYQYATSFHWSLTQFTPASMHVQPQNLVERGFAIMIVVFALVGFSYLVGSITGSLTQLRSLQEDEAKQFWNLRRYLKKFKVPPDLAHRIKKYLEHAWTQKVDDVSSDIKLFSLLSEQLHSELKCAMSVPHLKVHPLLEHLNSVSSVTMHRLANDGISRKTLASNDCCFIAGETATHMYVVVSGRLVYTKFDSKGNAQREYVDHAEDWIAEPVLWTPHWVHMGGLIAITETVLLVVADVKFMEKVRLNPQAFNIAKEYAVQFIDWLNCQEYDQLSDIQQGEKVGEIFKQFLPAQSEPQPALFSKWSTIGSHKP